MHTNYINDQTFEGQDYTSTPLPKAEYDNCSFINCDFSNSYLSTISFLECEFIDCNLSLAKTKEATFNTVHFNNCKLVGFPFQDCNDFLFSVAFTECQLNLATFIGMQLSRTVFKDCKLHHTDFSEANLNGSKFLNCDLKHTIFDQTNLERVDFKTAFNFQINPETNTIKQAIFSKTNVLGLLKQYHINIAD